MSRLKDIYQNQIVPELMKELELSNSLQVPKILRVVVNMGVGKAVKDKKELEEAVEEMRLITGQRPVIRKSKKAISGFGLRKGIEIGCSVTLRGQRMYEFLDKLFNIVLPRTRDFQGLRLKAFDGHGNYSLGLREQLVFPEIDPNQTRKLIGLQAVIVTDAGNDEKAELLLRKMGCPLRERE